MFTVFVMYKALLYVSSCEISTIQTEIHRNLHTVYCSYCIRDALPDALIWSKKALIWSQWDFTNKCLNKIFSLVQVWHHTVLSLLLFHCLPTSPPEARPCTHVLCPHALGLWPGQWRRAGRGPVDGAGARTSPAAPERLPEERPGAGQGQEATRRAAIAREEGGSSTLPSHIHTPLLQLLHPSVPHSSCFSFVVLSTKKTSHLSSMKTWHQDLRREREEKLAGNMLSHCHRKNTTVLTFPCSHTEPRCRGEKNVPFRWEQGMSTVFWMV